MAGARAALTYRDFRLYQAARFALTLGIQMQSVAIGWNVYSLTGRPIDLGYVGLAQFLPAIALSLLTGAAADRFDRRNVLVVCYSLIVTSALLLWSLTRIPNAPLMAIYAVLILFGTARAFAGPASQALVPHLVPAEHFPNAVTWSSTTFQVATIVGPAMGGVLYGAARRPGPVYLTAALLVGAALCCLLAMRTRTGRMESGAGSWNQLVAGIRYVWEQRLILGSISLDLFAVLLGGATALLPIFASDILRTGPWGLGLLRSAPAAGAAVIAVALAHRPLKRNAGNAMLFCVALFGVATIVFGLSRNFWVSLVALAIAGAADMVSVVVRITLVQLATPPQMRGRVSAVNMVFIGASNELGEFESGLTAEWWGPVRSVVGGGIGTCLVVAAWTGLFPQLRRINRIEDATLKAR